MKATTYQLEIIDLITSQFPEIIFGGSIALNALGLIDRPIGDIDIFYTDKKVYTMWLKSLELQDSEYENDVEMFGYWPHRICIKINDVKVCGFEIPPGKETEFIERKFCGRILKVQNSIYAIVAKAIYSDKTQKHAEDLKNIQQKFMLIADLL